MQNKDDRRATTLDELTLLQGRTKGKREYSSITMRRYGLGPISVPFKSTLRWSHGRTACMSVCEGGLKKEGFTSAHVLQLQQTFLALHKNKLNNACAQSDKDVHNQGGAETAWGFAEKPEKTKHKHGRIHRTRRFRCQVCDECRKSCDSSLQPKIFAFFIFPRLPWSNTKDTASWSDQSKTSSL